MKTMILLVVLGMVAMASCQTDCIQRTLDTADCVASLVWTIIILASSFFACSLQLLCMQGTAAGDTTQFCDDCADELRDFYNDCAEDGAGVDLVDSCKSLWD